MKNNPTNGKPYPNSCPAAFYTNNIVNPLNDLIDYLFWGVTECTSNKQTLIKDAMDISTLDKLKELNANYKQSILTSVLYKSIKITISLLEKTYLNHCSPTNVK